jgi:hypothetical protein
MPVPVGGQTDRPSRRGSTGPGPGATLGRWRPISPRPSGGDDRAGPAATALAAPVTLASVGTFAAPTYVTAAPARAPAPALTFPVIEESHAAGWCSIIGGYVVRDPALRRATSAGARCG